MTTLYLEDFKPGLRIRSPRHTVTEQEIFEFAKKYDPQDYHLDHDAAKASVFGGLASGGFQTASLAWGLALRTGHFHESGLAGIGVDNLRWLRPMRVNDTVYCDFEVKENRPSQTKPDRGVIIAQYDLFNQDGEHIFMMTMIQMLKTRAGLKNAVGGNGATQESTQR